MKTKLKALYFLYGTTISIIALQILVGVEKGFDENLLLKISALLPLLLLLGPFWGYLSDKTNKTKPYIMLSGVIIFLGGFGMCFGNQNLYLFGEFCMYLGVSMLITNTDKLTNILCLSTDFSYGELFMFHAIGVICGCLFTMFLPLKESMCVVLFSGLFIIFVSYTLGKETLKMEVTKDDSKLKELFYNSGFILVLIISFLVVSQAQACESLLLGRYAKHYGAVTQIGVILGVGCEIVYSKLSCQFDENKKVKNGLYFATITLIIGYSILLIAPVVDAKYGKVAFYIGAILKSGSYGLALPLLMGIVSRIVPKKFIGTASSLIISSGTAFGSVVLGQILNMHSESFIWILSIFISFNILSIPFIYVLHIVINKKLLNKKVVCQNRH